MTFALRLREFLRLFLRVWKFYAIVVYIWFRGSTATAEVLKYNCR